MGEWNEPDDVFQSIFCNRCFNFIFNPEINISNPYKYGIWVSCHYLTGNFDE